MRKGDGASERRSIGASEQNRSKVFAPTPRRPDAPTRLTQWDRRHLWHPFTQQTEWAAREPIIIASGRGVWLRDIRGRKLLDGNSSLWVNVWGHNQPQLNAALRQQLSKIAHATFLGLTHEPAVVLAKQLVELAPQGLTRVFYSDNGSTSVEVAVKMAYQYWQLKGRPAKSRFVSLKEGYHGDTLGSVSVGGIGLFHERFHGLLFKGWQVSAPLMSLRGAERRSNLSKNDGLLRFARNDGMKHVLDKYHKQIAAVVMEPLVQGASGMLVMPKGYLAHVARLCRRYDVLLIVDEVATGFGRTGTMFACEQEKVSPDFLCVAKSLTGGYLPLAATLAKEKIFRAFLGRYEEFKTFFHGHTYTANPLACAVAIENLKLYQSRNLLANVRARSTQLARGMQSLKAHPHVKEIRQVGLMVGIEIAEEKDGAAYPPASRMGLKVCEAAIRRGVWLRPLGDVIVLMPPLAITANELNFLMDVTRAAIEEGTA